MKYKMLVVGIAILLLCIGISGCLQQSTKIENNPPTVSFNADPITGYQPLNVSFHVNASDSDGLIKSCRIEFGDGVVSYEMMPTHTYFVGTYTAIVTVTDDKGAETSKNLTIIVKNLAPITNASANMTSGIAPLTVHFIGSGNDSDGSIQLYYWDFGDGANSTEQNPTHTFQNNGTYSVTLTVTDNNGATANDTVTIIASSPKTKKENGGTNGNNGGNNQGGSPPNNPPTALASASPITGFAPLTVNFTGHGIDTDGVIQSYFWDFGDGNTSNQQNPTHVYYHNGSYAVALVVTDDDGATGVDTAGINVEEKPMGLSVTHVTGHVSNETIDKIVIFTSLIAGSNDVNLNSVSLNLNNSTSTVQLYYDNNSYCNNISGGIFDLLCFNLTNQQFGIVVIRDTDNSITKNNPVMNMDDLVILTVNTISCFNGIPPRTHISGFVIPEKGTSGLILFVTPTAYPDTIIDLQ